MVATARARRNGLARAFLAPSGVRQMRGWRVLVLRATDRDYLSRMTPWVKRLLIANVAVYFLQITAPGVTQMMAFAPSLVLVRPWTILTYMFAHSPGGITHILFNMIALYFFGPRVEERLG